MTRLPEYIIPLFVPLLLLAVWLGGCQPIGDRSKTSTQAERQSNTIGGQTLSETGGGKRVDSATGFTLTYTAGQLTLTTSDAFRLDQAPTIRTQTTQPSHSESSTVSTTTEKADEPDWVAVNSKTLFIIGAMAIVGGLVLCYWFRVPGLLMAGGGAVVVLLPILMPVIKLAMIVALILLGIGLVALTVWYFHASQSRKAAVPGVVKLLTEGKTSEAVAAWRAADPAADKAYQAAKTAKTEPAK